jgi:phage anti-repressor protein
MTEITTKSTAELSADFIVAYESVKPLAAAFEKRVRDAIETIDNFQRANSWFPETIEDYGWVETVDMNSIDARNILDETVYMTDLEGYEDITLTFFEVDNIEKILKAKLAADEVVEATKVVEDRAKRRAKLVRKLAELDAEEDADV